MDLSNVNFDTFEMRKLYVSGHLKRKRHYRVVFDLVIVMEDDLGHIRFCGEVNGTSVGEQRLKFED